MLHSLWILAATFFTVLTYVFVKWVPPQYEIWDIFFVRSCYMAFFAVLMAAVAKTPLKTKIPKAHIGRAICGMLALLINIVTVQHLQIGTAETLFYTMPLFVWHCCKVSDEAAFCLIQRPYISKTLLTRRISPRGSP